MKVEDPWRRLEAGHFWKMVDAEHNRQIARRLAGCGKVLDIGCGFGSLTAYMNRKGFDCVGVDTDQESVDRARILFPDLADGRTRVMGGEALAFPDSEFDGIVLRDTLHHLWEEGNVEQAFDEIERVLRPGGVLVIFDPNPNIVVLTCRWIVRHEDARCTYQEARQMLIRRGWVIQEAFFTEAFALALSGGYVGIDFIPALSFMHKLLLHSNRIVSRCISFLGLGSTLLWRYGIRAEFHKLDGSTGSRSE